MVMHHHRKLPVLSFERTRDWTDFCRRSNFSINQISIQFDKTSNMVDGHVLRVTPRHVTSWCHTSYFALCHVLDVTLLANHETDENGNSALQAC